MLNLRALYDRYRVEYRDHGPNTSAQHINIRCPFCSDDPSYHMGISESTGQYYCFRNPRHSGSYIAVVLKKLNLPKSTYENLKVDPSAGSRHTEDNRDYTPWRYFKPASENQEALDYLASRKFLNPEAVAKKFNLKVADEGEWAGRLLIPLTVGWTGRAMRDHIEPRYKAYTSEDGFYYFGYSSSSAVVVEGAIDGMRVASVSNQYDIYGKCRIAMASSMFIQMRKKNYQSIYSAPDSTVTYSQAREELKTIKSYCTKAAVKRILLTAKDFGELSESEARATLRSLGYDSSVPVLRQSF